MMTVYFYIVLPSKQRVLSEFHIRKPWIQNQPEYYFEIVRKTKMQLERHLQ